MTFAIAASNDVHFTMRMYLFIQGRGLTMSIHPVLFLESPIVQICEFEHLLLVSNYNKCILCNTETEEFKQVGEKTQIISNQMKTT